jgi:cyanophycinase
VRRVLLAAAVGSLLAAAPPRPPRGALVIVGGGRVTPDIERAFVTLAGGKAARVVVVPTASGYADDPRESRSFTERWRKAGAASVALLHTRKRAEADTEAFVKPLREATGVWLSGGDQSRLTAAYGGTAVERELKQLVGRGGVVGGTSAGAAVMSELMITGGRREATTGKGFGLLKGVVVDQHFLKRDRVVRLLGVLERAQGPIGVGIDEATAVVVRGDELEVVGDSYVMAFRVGENLNVRTLRHGDRVRLDDLRKAR